MLCAVNRKIRFMALTRFMTGLLVFRLKKNAAVPLSFSHNYTHQKNSSDGHDHSDDHQPVCGET